MNKSILIPFLAIFIFAACSGEKNNEQAESSTETTQNQETIGEKATAGTVVSKEQLESMLTAYFDIKDALVGTNVEKAKSAAEKLLSHLNGDGKMDDIKESASQIKQEEDVENIRAEFHELSKNLYEVVKNNASLKDETVYKQFCPMAFNNTGGFWLSSDKEIKNPYFGDKMLKCGKVQEEI